MSRSMEDMENHWGDSYKMSSSVWTFKMGLHRESRQGEEDSNETIEVWEENIFIYRLKSFGFLKVERVGNL